MGMHFRGVTCALAGARRTQLERSCRPTLVPVDGASVSISFFLSALERPTPVWDGSSRPGDASMKPRPKVEATEETWLEVDVHRTAGEIALMSSKPETTAKAEAHFERALEVARAQQARSWGASRGDEPRTPLARSGPARRRP